jgi:hypothetical protein
VAHQVVVTAATLTALETTSTQSRSCKRHASASEFRSGLEGCSSDPMPVRQSCQPAQRRRCTLSYLLADASHEGPSSLGRFQLCSEFVQAVGFREVMFSELREAVRCCLQEPAGHPGEGFTLWFDRHRCHGRRQVGQWGVRAGISVQPGACKPDS